MFMETAERNVPLYRCDQVTAPRSKRRQDLFGMSAKSGGSLLKAEQGKDCVSGKWQ